MPVDAFRPLAQNGVKPAMLHTAGAGHIAVTQLIPVAVAQQIVALGTAEHPGRAALEALPFRHKAAAVPLQQSVRFIEDPVKLIQCRLRRLRPAFMVKLLLPALQLSKGGQSAQQAHHLRTDAGRVIGVVAGVMELQLVPKPQFLHCVLQCGLLVAAHNHQVKGPLEIVDVNGQILFHAIPRQVQIQHLSVAGPPGEKLGIRAAPIKEGVCYLRKTLGAEQIFLIQRKHFAHAMVQLFMNGRTDIGRERHALCLPVFQLIGAELDDLIQLVRLAAGIPLIPFQIKKYITHIENFTTARGFCQRRKTRRK